MERLDALPNTAQRFAEVRAQDPAGQFGDADQERLAAAMRAATGRGVLITMTNSDTDATRRIYAGFTATTMATRRDINLRSDARASSDLILTNY